jgi:acetyl-CoA synthetase (ADP-forming)
MNKTSEIISQAYVESRKALLENEAKTICAEYNIPVTKFKLAKTCKESVESARQIGFPVVLKIVSPDIIHKSDSGGVMLNLKTASNVENAFNVIMDNAKRYDEKARILGVLVQEMVPSSIEVIVGSVKDPQFGQTLMFGLGGIFVEILKDVTFRVAPILKEEAAEMISEVKAYPLLKGYRNTPVADIDALTKLLVNTSDLIMENTEIKELDLNPVMVYERGLKVVDARIILE